MATRLRKLRLSELSLVDSPANADAVVTLAKRYDEKDVEKGERKLFDDVSISADLWKLTDALSSSLRSILDDTDEEKKSDIEKTVDQFKAKIAGMVKKSDEGAEDEDEMEDELEEEEEEDLDEDEEEGEDDDSDDDEEDDASEEEDEDDDADGDESVEESEDDGAALSADAETTDTEGAMSKRLDEDVSEPIQKALDAANAVAKAATDEVAKIREEQAVEKSVSIAKSTLGNIPADATVFGAVIRKLDDTEKAAFATLCKAYNALLAETNLYATYGDRGAEGTDAVVKAAASELQKSDPKMTAEQAFAKALEANASAYEASLAN